MFLSFFISYSVFSTSYFFVNTLPQVQDSHYNFQYLWFYFHTCDLQMFWYSGRDVQLPEIARNLLKYSTSHRFPNAWRETPATTVSSCRLSAASGIFMLLHHCETWHVKQSHYLFGWIEAKPPDFFFFLAKLHGVREIVLLSNKTVSVPIQLKCA